MGTGGAVWRRIAGDLAAAIEAGDYQPGQAIPTETELSDRYGAVRTTVRRAIEELERQGVVERRTPPRRTVVAARRQPRTVPGAHPAAAPATVTIEIDTPPAPVATRLQLPPGGLVLTRRATLTDESGPYATTAAHHPYELAKDTAAARPGEGPPLALDALAGAGVRIVRYVDEVTSRHATTREAAQLGIPAGYPVTEQTRTGYDHDGRPVVCVVTVLARATLVYDTSSGA